MLGLSETINQLATTNSVQWHDHVLRNEDGHVLKKEALRIKLKGTNGGQRENGKKLSKKHEGWSIQRKFMLPIKVNC